MFGSGYFFHSAPVPESRHIRTRPIGVRFCPQVWIEAEISHSASVLMRTEAIWCDRKSTLGSSDTFRPPRKPPSIFDSTKTTTHPRNLRHSHLHASTSLLSSRNSHRRQNHQPSPQICTMNTTPWIVAAFVRKETQRYDMAVRGRRSRRPMVAWLARAQLK